MLKGLAGLGGLGDMAKMMKAAPEMQAKMAALRDEPARMMQDIGLPADMTLPPRGQTRPQITNA